MVGESVTKTTLEHSDKLPNGKELTIKIGVKVESRRGGRRITDTGDCVYVMKIEYNILDQEKVFYGIGKSIGIDKDTKEIIIDTPYIIKDHLPPNWRKTGFKEALAINSGFSNE